MKEEENLKDIIEEVKDMDKGINSVIIPILKDTINDCNRYNRRMFITHIILLIILTMVVVVSIILLYKQNIKYQEFLNQFDFQSEYIQDLDATDGGDAIINDGINVKR